MAPRNVSTQPTRNRTRPQSIRNLPPPPYPPSVTASEQPSEASSKKRKLDHDGDDEEVTTSIEDQHGAAFQDFDDDGGGFGFGDEGGFNAQDDAEEEIITAQAVGYSLCALIAPC